MSTGLFTCKSHFIWHLTLKMLWHYDFQCIQFDFWNPFVSLLTCISATASARAWASPSSTCPPTSWRPSPLGSKTACQGGWRQSTQAEDLAMRDHAKVVTRKKVRDKIGCRGALTSPNQEQIYADLDPKHWIIHDYVGMDLNLTFFPSLWYLLALLCLYYLKFIFSMRRHVRRSVGLLVSQ